MWYFRKTYARHQCRGRLGRSSTKSAIHLLARSGSFFFSLVHSHTTHRLALATVQGRIVVKIMVQACTLCMLITSRSRLWFRRVRLACSSLRGQGHGSGVYARHAHHFAVKVMVQAGTLGMLITLRSRLWFRVVRSACSSLRGQGYG